MKKSKRPRQRQFRLRELDLAVLTRDIGEHDLVQGDIGTVVDCYADGEAYEVEFVTSAGDTIAV